MNTERNQAPRKHSARPASNNRHGFSGYKKPDTTQRSHGGLHTATQRSHGPSHANTSRPTHTQHITKSTHPVNTHKKEAPHRKPFVARKKTTEHTERTVRKEHKLLPIAGDDIRIIPLGGVEEVGKNMIIVEYKDTILVFDCGFQFTTDDENPGVDYIIPNIKYLEENKHKIKAIIITHGHLDHIGGIPYILDRIGNPPIYGRYLTTLMVKKKVEEFKHIKDLNIKVVEPRERIQIGDLFVKFIEVTHSIPDSMGVSIETPKGNIVITGDLKLDHKNGIPSEKEERNWGEIAKDKNILLVADSTNVEKPGFSITEVDILENIEELIKQAPNRVILGTFASQFERMIKIIGIAEKYNKKVVTEGRSIKTNIEIAKLAGILKTKDDTFIRPEDMNKYPSDRVLILATGAQGEEFAALMRMATKKNKYIQLSKNDTIILSSSIVPGNEISVRKLKDNLFRHDLKIIHYQVSDVHSTGHGNAGELAWINKMVNAKYFIPAYGNHSMLKVHAEVARSIGMKSENIIVPDNGSVIEIKGPEATATVLKDKAPANIMMVDGFSVGDIQEVVIRDRQTLAQDGIFVVIATVDINTGKLRKSPDIISRGFVYLRESQELLQLARRLVKKTVEDNSVGMKPINFDIIKKEVTDNVGRFLLKKTDKRPIVIPVILGV